MNGEPYFVGKDVAVSLGYAKPENAISAHVDQEDKTTTLIQGDGSNYKSKTTLINESGLYSLILPTVLARDLHEFLKVETPFHKWFPRMCEYGFAEDEDYRTFLSNRSDGLPGKSRQDAQLTIDMAKEICMLQRNEKGKQARQYFLQLEKEWNSPEAVMARALRMAQEKLERVKAINSNLTVQNAIMQPKAEYFDGLCERESLTGIRDTAKLLGIKQNDFVKWLISSKLPKAKEFKRQ